MPTSSTEATNQCTPFIPLIEELASQDHQKLPTRTEEDVSWLIPWEQIIPGTTCGPATATTSLQEELREEGTCPQKPQISQSENLSGRTSL